MEEMIASKSVSFNEEGFMNDFSQWNRDIGIALAKNANLELTTRHWDVINFLQNDHKNGIAQSIRKIRKSGIVDIKEFYQLFPMAPLKTASKIAGIPKPVSCI